MKNPLHLALLQHTRIGAILCHMYTLHKIFPFYRGIRMIIYLKLCNLSFFSNHIDFLSHIFHPPMDSSTCIKMFYRKKVNNVPNLTITSGFATSLTFENKFQINSTIKKRAIDSECQHRKKI